MNRKEFLRASGCCAVLALLQRASGETVAAPALSAPLPAPPPPAPPPSSPAPPLTSAEHRVAFAERWVKRFFDVFDAHLDEATREKIMRANGRVCHTEGSKNQPVPPNLDAYIGRIQAHLGNDVIRREGNVVYFSYLQNPRGLKVADGYCLCPLVETGPQGLSGTFCLCSVGYVQHMFENIVGHPVQVELLESLKRGGKGCRFKITVA